MYDFESGLSQMERLEVLTASPLLRLSSECLPRHGMSTKPAVADPAALMVLGAATVTFGSDRAADRELRAHWPRLRDTFEEAGLPVPDRALRAQHFRYYRDCILGGGLPEEWKGSARDLFRGLALEIGLFPEVASSWIDPHPHGIVSSDGTWFAAASEVVDMSTSRSTTGRPRVVGDADRKHKYDRKGLGYMVCITSVRGSAQRERVVLDVSFAPNSAEMDVVIPTIANLRDHLGDRLRCVVFDGAMRGVHHRALRSLGVLTVNKPAGSRRLDQWRAHIDTVVGQEAKVLRIDSGCVHEHLVTVTAGMFWELEPSGGGKYRRRRVLEVRDVRRLPSGGGYRWELDVELRCGSGSHIYTVDPNATIPCATGAELMKAEALTYRSKLNLSETLRILQMNDEQFAVVFGRRNDSEAGNKNAKFDFGLGHRARSYTRQRHETDLWLYALLANSLVWQEHRQRVGGRRQAA